MEEWLRDPQALRDVLLRRTLRAMITASGALLQAARGKGFKNDEQRWASLQLVRLAPALIGPKHVAPEEPVRNLCHPNYNEAEHAALADVLNRKTGFASAEESAQWWAERFRLHGPFREQYETEEEAYQWGLHEWNLWESDRRRDQEQDQRETMRNQPPQLT